MIKIGQKCRTILVYHVITSYLHVQSAGIVYRRRDCCQKASESKKPHLFAF